MGAILGFLGGLLGNLLKIFIQTPPPVAVEAQKLGQAQQKLADVQASDASTAAGDAAASQTERSAAADPGSVRQPDIFSRD